MNKDRNTKKSEIIAEKRNPYQAEVTGIRN